MCLWPKIHAIEVKMAAKRGNPEKSHHGHSDMKNPPHKVLRKKYCTLKWGFFVGLDFFHPLNQDHVISNQDRQRQHSPDTQPSLTRTTYNIIVNSKVHHKNPYLKHY